MKEMNTLKNCPKVLLQKILFTTLIGASCFIVGAAYFLYAKDTMTLALSCLVLLFSLFRSIGLYRTIAKQKYEVVEGTCVGVAAKPLRKHFTVKIMDDAGIESTLRLGKQAKVKIGFRYCFYFNSQGERLSVGSEYFDIALSSNQFLGFEELGEFEKQAPDSAPAKDAEIKQD